MFVHENNVPAQSYACLFPSKFHWVHWDLLPRKWKLAGPNRAEKEEPATRETWECCWETARAWTPVAALRIGDGSKARLLLQIDSAKTNKQSRVNGRLSQKQAVVGLGGSCPPRASVVVLPLPGIGESGAEPRQSGPIGARELGAPGRCGEAGLQVAERSFAFLWGAEVGAALARSLWSYFDQRGGTSATYCHREPGNRHQVLRGTGASLPTGKAPGWPCAAAGKSSSFSSTSAESRRKEPCCWERPGRARLAALCKEDLPRCFCPGLQECKLGQVSECATDSEVACLPFLLFPTYPRLATRCALGSLAFCLPFANSSPSHLRSCPLNTISLPPPPLAFWILVFLFWATCRTRSASPLFPWCRGPRLAQTPSSRLGRLLVLTFFFTLVENLFLANQHFFFALP